MDIIKWKPEEKVNLADLKNLDQEFDFSNSTQDLFIIKDKGLLIGYAVLEAGEKSILKRIFIKKENRNCGYGTKLLKYIINILKEQKSEELIIEDHKNANNFLERLKFIRENNLYIRRGLSYKKKKKEKAISITILNLFINIILASLRIIFGYIGKSSSLTADGVNSLTDCVSNIIAIVGLKTGSRPEDEHHPFGHGKMESIMSIIIGTLIIVAASNILVENIVKLIQGEEVFNPPILLIIISIISLLIKIGQYALIYSSGKKLNNNLILALSKDYKADIIISTSVLIGIFLSKYINPIIDPILGILVILYIIKEGYGIIKDSSLEILDTQDKEFLDELYEEVMKIKGVKNAHDFHMSKSGDDIYVFMDIRVDKNISVKEAHELSHEISKIIKLKYISVKDVIIHVEPMY